MNPAELSSAYLTALRGADIAAMLSLFTDDAVVQSPLYQARCRSLVVLAGHAGWARTGRCLMPWRKLDRSRWIGPVTSTWW